MHRAFLRCAPPAVLALAAALGLSACVDPASVALTGASMGLAAETGKTIPDHVMSYMTGEECSYSHQISGKAWCQPKPSELAEGPERHCYRSIGVMTCYVVENPYETTSRKVR